MGQFAHVISTSTNSTGTAARYVVGRPTPCTYENYDVGAYWKQRFKAKADTLALSSRLQHQVLPYEIHSTTISQYANKFYGSFIRNNSVLPSQSPLYFNREDAPYRGSRLKYKEFKRRQAAGEILLSDSLNRKVSVVVGPSIHKSQITAQSSMDVIHTQLFKNEFPVVPTGCPSRPTSPLDQENGWLPSVLPGTRFTYRAYTYVGDYKVQQTQAQISEWVENLYEVLGQLEVDTGLVTSARSEAASGILDLTTTIAELPETLKMIYEAIRLILAKYLEVRKQIKVLKRNKISQADFVSQVTSLWMQYRYGIMPNVLTIQDGLTYLYAETHQYQTVRQGMGDFSVEIPPLGGWACDPQESVHRVFLKNRFQLQTLTKSAAFLKTNLLSTAWELVPLSFVIDWALNVGDFLSALGRPSGSIQEASMASWQFKDHVFELVNPDYIGGNITVKLGYYRAVKINPSDHIGLNLGLSMNLMRVLDALSLSWGATSTEFKRKLSRSL